MTTELDEIRSKELRLCGLAHRFSDEARDGERSEEDARQWVHRWRWARYERQQAEWARGCLYIGHGTNRRLASLPPERPDCPNPERNVGPVNLERL